MVRPRIASSFRRLRRDAIHGVRPIISHTACAAVDVRACVCPMVHPRCRGICGMTGTSSGPHGPPSPEGNAVNLRRSCAVHAYISTNRMIRSGGYQPPFPSDIVYLRSVMPLFKVDSVAPEGKAGSVLLRVCSNLTAGTPHVYEATWFTNSAITWFTLYEVSNQLQDHRISVAP